MKYSANPIPLGQIEDNKPFRFPNGKKIYKIRGYTLWSGLRPYPLSNLKHGLDTLVIPLTRKEVLRFKQLNRR